MKSFKTFFAERCWPGYKSVPGKKAYSPGSCVKESAAAAIAAATDYIQTAADYLYSEMKEEVEQINEAITHGDYIITHKPYNGTDKQRHVSNDITHAYSTNQKKLGIKHSEEGDEIGPDRHITVKNKKTGEVSNHVATHNNTYKDEGQRQKISIRAHGEVTPHDEKHAKVIKSFLA